MTKSPKGIAVFTSAVATFEPLVFGQDTAQHEGGTQIIAVECRGST
jgi:hypothetical protein